jgi:O-antigen/teichoic acid export membrane protein
MAQSANHINAPARENQILTLVNEIQMGYQIVAYMQGIKQRIVDNRTVRNSLFGGLNFGVPILLMLVFTPFLVNKMGAHGYGLWNIATASLGLLGVMEFGLGAALEKHIAEYRQAGDLLGISSSFTASLIYSVVLGLILTIPIYFAAPKIATLFQSPSYTPDTIQRVIQLASFGFLPMMIKNSALAVPKGLQLYHIFSGVNIWQNILTLLAATFLVAIGQPVIAVVLSTVLVFGLSALASLIIALNLLRSLKIPFVIQWKYSRKIFSFMVYTGLQGIGGRIFSWMDRLTIGAVLGIDAVTYYTVAIGIANKFLAFSDALTQPLMPAASSMHAVKDHRKLIRLNRRYSLGIIVMNLLLGTVVLMLSKIFLLTWMGPGFMNQTLTVFRILVIIYVLVSVTAPAYHIANGIGLPHLNAITSLSGGILTIALIIFLGGRYGLLGAGIANIGYTTNLLIPAVVHVRLNHLDNKDH